MKKKQNREESEGAVVLPFNQRSGTECGWPSSMEG